ncbi:MAG: hypothetical protein Q3982_01230 [Phoenicibacter congonensis]|uniref:Lipoprotein n=1 Tax=Phoenicibacter congonensis TaxID=1944646 RepID=A0AA43U5K0_9ACTN|nr:hypothetical protein [Phoenicibacter congonensis]
MKATMKFCSVALVLVAMALCFSLVGCGGTTQKVTDFTWYKAAVPENYEKDTHFGDTAAKVRFVKNDEGKTIEMGWNGVSGNDAQTIAQNKIDWYGSDYAKQLDDVKLGNYTWKVVEAEGSNKDMNTFYFVDLGENLIGEVDGYGFTHDDKVIQDYLKSVTFSENLKEDYAKAKEIKADTLEIH